MREDALARLRATARTAGVPVEAAAGVSPLRLDPERPPWFALGNVFESATDDGDRRRRGVHFTPPWLARAMAAQIVDADTDVVVDPACGGGVFLLAAAERLVECGVEPAQALARLLGHDTHQESRSVTELALRWWAHHHGAAWDGVELSGTDPLLLDPAGVSPSCARTVVLANPPFLDQLDHRSARDEIRRGRLARRFGPAITAYTDDAALFLAWAVDVAGERGRVAMVLPRSMLAARDGEGVRRHVERRTTLRSVWFDDADTFEADVRVWVAITDPSHDGPVELLTGHDLAPTFRAPRPEPASWAPLLAANGGVPPVELCGSRTVGDLAEVVAGFRDEYYGLIDAVHELDAAGCPDAAAGRLVTAGAVDLAHDRWGTRPIRFAKRRWSRPFVDLDEVASPRVRAWAERLLVPKVLVATQTRVVEAVVDDAGDAIGSVPVLNILPRNDADRWLVAAAVAAPPVTAWALRRRAGAALSADALKMTAADVRAVTLPPDRRVWEMAARCFEEAQRANSRADRLDALHRFGQAMTTAHACGPGVFDWWWARLTRS